MARHKNRDEDNRDLGLERGEEKGGTTSLRITPATRTAADWIARVNGQSFNAAFSHAVALLAEATKYRGAEFNDAYHPHEGVWWCRLFLLGLTKEKDDMRRFEFMSAHKPFFFVKHGKEWKVDEQKIAALWPQIGYLTDHWHKRRDMDAWATGEKMQGILRDAKITAPAWGPTAEVDR